MSDHVTIAAAHGEVSIALVGAELLSLRLKGRDLLWQADPAWWGGTSPILFPVVGRVAGGVVRVDGKDLPMAPHGFARTSTFRVGDRTDTRVTLTLEDDAQTSGCYPFRFRLDVIYDIGEAGLSVGFVVTNRGSRPMPYAIGFHPGFRWPHSGGGRQDYAILFEQREENAAATVDSDGLLSPDKIGVPMDGVRLDLDDGLFEGGRPVCFLNANSSALRFAAPTGEALTMRWENFPHLALWTKPGAPFLCIEPWTGHSDPQGFADALADKPGMRMLDVGASATHTLSLGY